MTKLLLILSLLLPTSLTSKVGTPPEVIAAMVDTADSLYRIGHYDEAIVMAQKADTVASFNWQLQNRIKAWSILGMAYNALGDTEKSVFYTSRCCVRTKDVDKLISVTDNLFGLAKLYYSAGEYEEAARYAETSCNVEMMMSRVDYVSDKEGFTSRIFLALHDYDNAIEYANDAMGWADLLDSDILMACRKLDLGVVKEAMGELEEAYDLYLEALPELTSSSEHKEAAIECLLHLFGLKSYHGEKSASIAFFRQGAAIARTMPNVRNLRDMYSQMSEYLTDIDREVSDSLASVAFDMRYQVYMEDCVSQLAMITLNAMRREQDTVVSLQKEKVHNITTIAILSIVIAVMFIILAIFLAYYLHKKAKLNHKLAKEVQIRTHVLSILTHDLKGPSIARRTALRMLSASKNALSPEEFERLCLDLSRQADCELDLLENTLRWARIQVDQKGELPILRLNVRTTLQDLVSNQSQVFSEKHQTCRLEDCKDLFVKSNISTLQVILRNLLTNASKFTPSGGHINVKVLELPFEQDARGGVEIRISDDGIGMNNETLAKLFTPGVYSHNVGTDGEVGSGLGLKVCRDLAKYLDIVLKFESAPGKGTTAIVYVPNIEK